MAFCGVYVDDCITVGDLQNPKWLAQKEKLKILYQWGKWETHKFKLCGIDYEQREDYSIKMTQTSYTQSLKPTEYPPKLKKQNGNTALDAHGVKCLRGINGTLQWLVSNTRVDLAARVSLSASETANPTVDSLQKADKIVRQAQHEASLPIYIQSTPLINYVLEPLPMQHGRYAQMAHRRVDF